MRVSRHATESRDVTAVCLGHPESRPFALSSDFHNRRTGTSDRAQEQLNIFIRRRSPRDSSDHVEGMVRSGYRASGSNGYQYRPPVYETLADKGRKTASGLRSSPKD